MPMAKVDAALPATASPSGPGTDGVTSIEDRLAEAGLPPLPRSTWLEIDMGALAANAAWFRRRLPAGARLGVVVKADGYGHGLLGAARAAVAGGASLLLVATVDEGLVLRRAGIGTPILVLFPVPPTLLPVAVGRRLDVVVSDEASLEAVVAYQRDRGRPGAGSAGRRVRIRVHLGIDTGMGRGGFLPDAAAPAAERLAAAGLAGLAGTWSHLATPEDPRVLAEQASRFEDALAGMRARGIDPGVCHLSATGGVLAGGPVHDLARIGLAFYGVVPPEFDGTDGATDAAAGLRPALALRGRAATTCELPAGSAVGYGGTWVAARPSRIATVGLGYADGWVRAYAGGSWAAVRGRRVPVIGRVSSDAVALDVTDVPGFGPHDVVTFLDAGDPAAMTVHDLARLRGSIAWEVLDALAPRLARVYLDGGRLVGVRYLDGRTVAAPGGRR